MPSKTFPYRPGEVHSLWDRPDSDRAVLFVCPVFDGPYRFKPIPMFARLRKLTGPDGQTVEAWIGEPGGMVINPFDSDTEDYRRNLKYMEAVRWVDLDAGLAAAIGIVNSSVETEINMSAVAARQDTIAAAMQASPPPDLRHLN